MKTYPPHGLPVRANRFLRLSIHDNFTAADVAKMKPEDFAHVSNFGKSTLAAIAEWLLREGYEPPFTQPHLRCPCCGQEAASPEAAARVKTLRSPS